MFTFLSDFNEEKDLGGRISNSDPIDFSSLKGEYLGLFPFNFLT